jgi:hypothetical protein
MARPQVTLDPAQVHEVETLAAVLTAEQIADYFGIGRTTFFRILEREPDVLERYKRGKAKAVGAIAQSLVSKARAGDTTAMIFYLKTQGGWRERLEVDARSELRIDPGRQVEGQSAGDRLRAYIDGIAEREREAGLIVHGPVGHLPEVR